jgi:membrane dipeptidase
MNWFDAHLDLAYLELLGRDMHAPVESLAAGAIGPHPPAAVTLPSLADGNVRACLGTIFTEADGTDEPIAYASGDVEGALAAGLRQLEVYHEWKNAGAIQLMDSAPASAAAPLRLGILIEGADPIRSPDDLEWWQAWGIIAVGMAWYKPSRYAGGNGTDLGLTVLGRELVKSIDALGLVHDASHLSDRALDELLSATDKPVIASHSNCRALFPPPESFRPGPDVPPSIPPAIVLQRHLTDEAIREIARRGGVIGLNLYSKFLADGLMEGGRATLDDCIRHIEHICDIAGHRRAVGLGSDMDGGFAASRMPQGIDFPRDLDKLAATLRARGWTEPDIEGFAWGNWTRFWENQLAQRR